MTAALGSWLDAAACRSYDPNLWFPDGHGGGGLAQAICATCPVVAQCERLWRSLPAALQAHGIWAGHGWTSCGDARGTNAGWLRHQRRGDPPCRPCRDGRARAKRRVAS